MAGRIGRSREYGALTLTTPGAGSGAARPCRSTAPIVHEGRLWVVTEQTAAKAMRAVMHDVSRTGCACCRWMSGSSPGGSSRRRPPCPPRHRLHRGGMLAAGRTRMAVTSAWSTRQTWPARCCTPTAPRPSVDGHPWALPNHRRGERRCPRRSWLILTGASIALVIVLARQADRGMFHLAEQRSGFRSRLWGRRRWGGGTPTPLTSGPTCAGWWHGGVRAAFRLRPHRLSRRGAPGGPRVEQDRLADPGHVAQMPRAHPRCGSRFFAVAVIPACSWSCCRSAPPPAMPFSLAGLVAVVAVIRWWRPLGTHIRTT